MAFRQRQDPEGFHRPVGRSLGIVSFRGAKVRIAVSDSQGAAPVKDRPAEPEPQIVQQQMLHLAHAQPVTVNAGESHRCPEGALAESIGQAAPVRQTPALPIEPAGKPGGDQGSPLPDPPAAFRILIVHQCGIQQAVKVKAPEGIVITLCRIVEIPAVRRVMAFHQVHVFLQAPCVHRHAVFQETDIDQDPEEAPVVLRHIIAVDLVQPPEQILPPVSVQRRQERVRRKGKAAADDGHFHHPLVGIPDVPPVFRVRRIRSPDQPFLPQRPEFLRLRTFACQHGDQRPQRPGPAFHAGHVLTVMGGSVSHIDPGFSRRHAGRQGPQELRRRPDQVLPRPQRITRSGHSLCLPVFC